MYVDQYMGNGSISKRKEKFTNLKDMDMFKSMFVLKT